MGIIARISVALFFLCYALTTLVHAPLGLVALAVLALIAGIALIAGQ